MNNFQSNSSNSFTGGHDKIFLQNFDGSLLISSQVLVEIDQNSMDR